MKTNLLCIAIVLSMVSLPSFAQWNSSPALNTPVCTFADKQIDLRMLDDGHSGVFIAWKDYRAGGIPDIYIQRVDSLGYNMWTNNGVALCTDPADQSTPSITTDMKGGAIVAWSDWRSAVERDLYAQRISANGTVLWTTNGVGVANKPQREHNEKICSDGAYGAYVVWEQQDNVNYWWNIWLQRIDSTGAPVWTVGGQPVGITPNYRLNPKAQKDLTGGLYVTWQEWTGAAYDIYVQHFDKMGNRKFGNDGIVVCGAAGVQTDPKIDPDSISGGVIIAWVDKRSGTNYDIYSQRVDSSGNMLWATDGVPVVTAAGNQSAVDILSNSKVGGTIYTWKDVRSGVNNNNDIYAQKLDVNGTPQWAANGIVITNAPNDQVNPNITGDGMGGAIIAWQDSSNNQWDVRSQRVDVNGNVLWTANGVDVSVAAGSQTSPKNVSDGMSGCIYAWQDSRAGAGLQDIYVHKIFWNGGNIGVADQSKGITAVCYPNPFENNFSLKFTLHKEEQVAINLLNITGEVMTEIVKSEKMKAGDHSLEINSQVSGLPAGIYFLQVKSAGFSETLKLVKTK